MLLFNQSIDKKWENVVSEAVIDYWLPVSDARRSTYSLATL
jgi:hypothetical protein